jgi:hypothetical protein
MAADIPFSRLGDLFEAISLITPHRKNARSSPIENKARTYFQDWVSKLDYPLPKGTGAVLFRFMFPEEDSRRRFV